MTNRKGGTERGKHAAERRKDEKENSTDSYGHAYSKPGSCGGGNDKSSESKKTIRGRKRYQM